MIHVDAEKDIAEWSGSGLDLMAECAGVIAHSIWEFEETHKGELDDYDRETALQLANLTMTTMIKEYMKAMDGEGDDDDEEEEKADEERNREEIQTRITQFRR